MTPEEAIAVEMRPTIRRAVHLVQAAAERDGIEVNWGTFGPVLARALAEYAARGDHLRHARPAGEG